MRGWTFQSVNGSISPGCAGSQELSPLDTRSGARLRLAGFGIVLAKGGKMTAERSYDAIVIGAGQGGKPLSMVLARAGFKSAVVEERYVGGTCVNYG